MRKIKLHYLVIPFVIIFFFHSIAEGCTCIKTKPCEANARASAVFVGKVAKLSTSKVNGYVPSNAMSTTFTSNRPVAQLQIAEIFRGLKGNEVDVFGGGTTCDYFFKEGESYLDYATEGEDGNLYTSICSGTSPIAEAKEDLNYLRGSAKISKGGTITGAISRIIFNKDKDVPDTKPIFNAEVIIENKTSRFRALANNDGKFELRDIPEGKYKIHTIPQTSDSRLSKYPKSPKYEWEIEVPNQGCLSVWFVDRPVGEITGKVVDEFGKPVGGANVYIASADRVITRENSNAVVADEKGNFKFDFLPAGNYYLGFNLYSGPFMELPYPETFYPGVEEKKHAKVIVLGKNQKLDGFVLTHPKRLPETKIEGVAVWLDGKLAAGVRIELVNPKTGYSEGNSVQTDWQGKFSIVGIEGQTYKLSALVNKGIPLVSSKPMIVKLERVNKPVRLIIQLQ